MAMENCFSKRHEDLKIRIVDGSTLAAACVSNSIPEKESEVLMTYGGVSKLGCGMAKVLCERGVKVQLLVDSEQFGGSEQLGIKSKGKPLDKGEI